VYRRLLDSSCGAQAVLHVDDQHIRPIYLNQYAKDKIGDFLSFLESSEYISRFGLKSGA
jgi:hypothetical protein